MKNTKVLFTTKWITYTAVLCALVAATGFVPPIVTPLGRIYWVDGMVLLAAFLMDPLSACIAGGMGSLLYDIFASPLMMLPSLLIHGLQGAVVSAILHYLFPKRLLNREYIRAIVASLAGAVVVVSGYFIYRSIVYGVPTAVTNIPRNIVQEIIGITVAMILCYVTTFKKQLKRYNLLPDFNREVLKKHPPETEDKTSIPSE